MIRHLAVAAGVFVALVGVAVALFPDTVIAISRQLVSSSGLYAAAAFRTGIGLVLIVAARESRAPAILGAIGVVVLVGALASPFFGVEAARERIAWEAAHITFFRLEGVAFVCVGALIVSALRSGRAVADSATADR